VLHEVGSGAIAEVWRAQDVVSGAHVAIKVMRAEELDLEDVQRMAQEVEILRKLHHPCIVQVFSTGVTDAGKPYVVMEWVDGINLRARLEAEAQRRIPPDDVVEIVNQICSALAEGHEHGVIHRDVKPENVLLAAPEHLAVKVVDFGMAKVLQPEAPVLTFDSKIFGTPEYMAPERVMGGGVDGAADVYGVAVMAFEMLTGARPYRGSNPVEVMSKHVQAPPPPLEGFAAAVQQVVHQGLAKEPQARPAPRVFAQELARAVTAGALTGGAS
jgi:serine/threonine-protein kinase